MNPSAHRDEPSTWSYRPGDWFGIFGEHATVLLPPSEKHRVGPLWELVDAGAGFDETLDALIASGLRQLPGFVLVSAEEAVTRVVLRGPARAAFTVGDEPVELDGSAATTWIERSLEAVSGMRLEVSEEGSPVALTTAGGLARVARVEQPALETPDGPPPANEHPEAVEPGPVAEPGPAAEKDPAAEPGPAAEPAFDRPSGPEDEPTQAVPFLSQVFGVRDDEAGVEPPEPSPAAAGELPTFAPAPVAPPFGPPIPPPPTVPPGSHAGPYAQERAAEPAEPAERDERDERATPQGGADETDHDGDTRAGGWDPAHWGPEQPGIPGQPPAPSVTTRPVARLVVSNGETVAIDRAVLVGRAPEARRFTSGEQPRLVTVPSPNQEISSTHLEVRPGSGADHGSAVVTDLGSTNGTVLVQPGLSPEDLQPGIAVQLIPGAVIDLGDGVTIQVTNP